MSVTVGTAVGVDVSVGVNVVVAVLAGVPVSVGDASGVMEPSIRGVLVVVAVSVGVEVCVGTGELVGVGVCAGVTLCAGVVERSGVCEAACVRSGVGVAGSCPLPTASAVLAIVAATNVAPASAIVMPRATVSPRDGDRTDMWPPACAYAGRTRARGGGVRAGSLLCQDNLGRKWCRGGNVRRWAARGTVHAPVRTLVPPIVQKIRPSVCWQT